MAGLPRGVYHYLRSAAGLHHIVPEMGWAEAGEGGVNTGPERNHIVRPFGLIGGRYAVDDAGERKYRLAWAAVTPGIFLAALVRLLSIPAWLVFGVLGLGLVVTTWLCIDIARNGRRLRRGETLKRSANRSR